MLSKDAEESPIYVGPVNRIIPLDKPVSLDKDVQDDASSYLALSWNFLHGTGLCLVWLDAKCCFCLTLFYSTYGGSVRLR